ncbi:14503_t:CDS:2 [Entrophospora sp. SA101]|nr:5882_t:CDS:2 [Entrophospora sp. SA101]CAJ0907506.1 14503_t:CDS:2 [Entrophospora sp. SA101]
MKSSKHFKDLQKKEEEQGFDNNYETKKRSSKHRPMEITSKKAVGRFRQVVELPNNIKKNRDPRFDNLSGKFNEGLFEKSYEFIEEYKKSEINEISKRIEKEKDIEEKQKLQQLLDKMKSKLIKEQDHRYKRQLKNERKKKELELVGKGKNPYFLKRAEENKLELIDKYKKINNNKKKLDNIIEKRRKKNASKEIKHLPFKKRRKLDR